jgi:hypothetical protein
MKDWPTGRGGDIETKEKAQQARRQTKEGSTCLRVVLLRHTDWSTDSIRFCGPRTTRRPWLAVH